MALLQFYGTYRGGGMFANFLYWLDYWGVRDIILPFILIFTIIFAIMQKVNLFGQKKYNVAIALAIALLTIIPHVTGTYPPGLDVINIINDSIPEFALLTVVVVLLLLMLGLGLGEAPYKRVVTGWAVVIAGIILLLIFGSAIIPGLAFMHYLDPSIISLIVILIVFGLIVAFVTGGKESTSTAGGAGQGAQEEIQKSVLKKLFGKWE
jgi:hypothetical protein